MDATKGNMETIKLEAKGMMKDYLTIYIVDSVLEKSAQVKTCAREMSERFQELDKSMPKVDTT